jgi:hypothetical protein
MRTSWDETYFPVFAIAYGGESTRWTPDHAPYLRVDMAIFRGSVVVRACIGYGSYATRSGQLCETESEKTGAGITVPFLVREIGPKDCAIDQAAAREITPCGRMLGQSIDCW